jgi:hypothetical protein
MKDYLKYVTEKLSSVKKLITEACKLEMIKFTVNIKRLNEKFLSLAMMFIFLLSGSESDSELDVDNKKVIIEFKLCDETKCAIHPENYIILEKDYEDFYDYVMNYVGAEENEAREWMMCVWFNGYIERRIPLTEKQYILAKGYIKHKKIDTERSDSENSDSE